MTEHSLFEELRDTYRDTPRGGAPVMTGPLSAVSHRQRAPKYLLESPRGALTASFLLLKSPPPATLRPKCVSQHIGGGGRGGASSQWGGGGSWPAAEGSCRPLRYEPHHQRRGDASAELAPPRSPAWQGWRNGPRRPRQRPPTLSVGYSCTFKVIES